MTISELPISGPYCVYDVSTGHFIYSMFDDTASGDIAPDIAVLPVVGLHSVGGVLYIDTVTA